MADNSTMSDGDIDRTVAEARAMAARLNTLLDVLASNGVACVSVAGFPLHQTFGAPVYRTTNRVSLVLNFTAAAKADGDAA